MHDSDGDYISQWVNLKNINLHPSWSDYYIDFINDRVMALYGVDGVFFDMVTENISWLNSGDIDLDNNGVKDSASSADKLWKERTIYLLQQAKQNINGLVVINGSSESSYQEYIGGRMFENFPTPWENLMHGGLRPTSCRSAEPTG